MCFRVERKRGPVWFAKYRLPDGRRGAEEDRAVWTSRGPSAGGYFTMRMADDWLQDVRHAALRGTLPGATRSEGTFAEAAEEWLRLIREDRERKPSMLADYASALRAHLLPAFGARAVESITPAEIEARRGSLSGLSHRSKNKRLIQMHGIFPRAQVVWDIPVNPRSGREAPSGRRVAVSRFRQRGTSSDILVARGA